MLNSPEINSPELKSTIELATDKELVDGLARHISNDCKTIAEDGTFRGIRDFYLGEARKVIGTIKDEKQQIRLQKYINIYSPKN